VSGGSGEQGKPGAFGGSGSNTVCDREKLIAELLADPDKLSAWAETVGIDNDPQTVADFIRKLHPVTLTRDTQVTNHSYSGGSAHAYQAILPKGTAVLADADGKPVARCRCGNPLSEPAELEKQTRCLNCPPNYQPPPPCKGKCYRPEPGAPKVKPIGTKDPIQKPKVELEKCRKANGSLKECRPEYEKVRVLCAANPLNPACDSSICFQGSIFIGGSFACSSYIDRGDILVFECMLEAQGVGVIDKSVNTLIEEVAGTIALQGTLSSYGGGTIEVNCMESGSSNAGSTRSNKLTAIRVGSVQ
jgi:hypothetical protein